MITVKTMYGDTVLKPTIFPDGTSQIWKLPEEILNGREFHIYWNFESEREIIDLYSFKALLTQPEELRYIALHIPYLPYARQDKPVSNQSTFNLEAFAVLINNLGFNLVTSVDVHNPKRTEELIENFKNIPVVGIHEKVIYYFAPTYIVFPDKGALDRYGKELSHVNAITCTKNRDQSTGKLLGTVLAYSKPVEPGDKFLIIDDLCDGGATFIEVANALIKAQSNWREVRRSDINIGLFVTHGVFSRGRSHLLDNGINKIYTTNSLSKNEDGYKV